MKTKKINARDGIVEVPDMDYYNNLTDETEMRAVLDELKP